MLRPGSGHKLANLKVLTKSVASKDLNVVAVTLLPRVIPPVSVSNLRMVMMMMVGVVAMMMMLLLLRSRVLLGLTRIRRRGDCRAASVRLNGRDASVAAAVTVLAELEHDVEA